MAINRKLLRKIAKSIRADPKRMEMGSWTYFIPRALANPYLMSRQRRELAKREPKCGTIGCIAGWAVILTDAGGNYNNRIRALVEKRISVNGTPFDMGTREKATRILGLTPSEASKLFYPEHWPQKFYKRLSKHKSGTQGYANVVVDVIEDFIATDGWPTQ